MAQATATLLSSPQIEVSECELVLKSFAQQTITTLASLSKKKLFIQWRVPSGYHDDNRNISGPYFDKPWPTQQKSLPPVPRPLPVCNREIPVIPGPIPSVPSPDDHQSITSEDKAQFLLSEPAQNCYFPEGIYISIALPMHKPKELISFKTHCHLMYQHSNQSILQIYLPISKLWEITPKPLVFQNLLWKSRTKFTHHSIFEDYYWIHWHNWFPNQVFLACAYQIFYTWNEDSWTVSRLLKDCVWAHLPNPLPRKNKN